MEQLSYVKNYRASHGYLSTVGHHPDVDYLEQAYVQALSVKTTQKISNYAVILDEPSYSRLASRHLGVFDEIILRPGPWSWAREWEVRGLSPWRHTVKMDTDVILPASIDHWWPALATHHVVFPTTAYTFRGDLITSTAHRQLWLDNDLPNTYTAFYYFDDRGTNSLEFFTIAREVSNHWDWFATEFLKNNWDTAPRDDEIFAIAAAIYGEERCTLPGSSVPTLVHMREVLQDLPTELPWHESIHFEIGDDLRVGHYPQYLPFHYISKTWLDSKIIKQYEQNYQKFLEGTSAARA